MKTALTDYYMDRAAELLEKEFGNNLQVAIKVEHINRLDKTVTLKVGLYDGKDFLSVFGVVTIQERDTISLSNAEGLIKTNFRDWVHLTTEGFKAE